MSSNRRLRSATAPGSNSIVVIAAVDPTTKMVARPAASFASTTAAATVSVMSCASPWPRVVISRLAVTTTPSFYFCASQPPEEDRPQHDQRGDRDELSAEHDAVDVDRRPPPDVSVSDDEHSGRTGGESEPCAALGAAAAAAAAAVD